MVVVEVLMEGRVQGELVVLAVVEMVENQVLPLPLAVQIPVVVVVDHKRINRRVAVVQA